MFLMNLFFFSVSKAKISEYSEKIEALAARLAAPVVCYYCIDSFFPSLPSLVHLLVVHRLQSYHS
jgi:hypothetical protein